MPVHRKCLFRSNAQRVAVMACFISLIAVLWLCALSIPGYAQTPAEPPPVPSPSAPAPTAPPVELPTTPPAPLPERILTPIPQQFDWVGREVRPNPLLEALLGLHAGRQQLLMSASLTGEYSDNFFLTETNKEEEFSLRAGLETVYRVERGRGFVALANSLSTTYRINAEEFELPFANLALTMGYNFPRLSLALNESFIRDDDTGQDPSLALRSRRETFLRNNLNPQVRYQFSRQTAATLGYSYVIVVNEDNLSDLTQSHGVTIGVQHRFSPVLRGGLGYAFTSTSGDDTTNQGDEAGDRRSHRFTADMAYTFNRRTSATVQAFGTLTDQSGTTPDTNTFGTTSDTNTYGMLFGVQRVLSSFITASVAIGPTVFISADGEERVFANWQVNLDGALPLFHSRRASITFSTNQGIEDTSTEVDNVGYVLRQTVSVALNYQPFRRLQTSLFADYTHTELLEGTGADADREDNYWRAGARVSYALTRILSLVGAYRYQQRDSNVAEDDFAENFVTLTLAAGFSVF
jgi:predicted porin